MDRLFPLQAKRIVFFGTSYGTAITLQAISYIFKNSLLTAIPDCSVESVNPPVSDISCIPSYMIEKEDIEKDGNRGADATEITKLPDYSWCYKRLLRSGPSVRPGEVYNPRAQPPVESYEDVSEEELEEEEISTRGALDAIEEDDDEGEEDW